MTACSALRVRLLALLPLLLGLALLLACDASVSDEPAAPIPEEEIPRPPDGAILINGVEYPLAVGSYCWGGSTRVLCVDTIGYITVLPYAQARPGDVVTLAGPLVALQFDRGFVRFGPAPGEPMTLGGQSSRREAWPSGFGPGNELPLDNGEIRLPIGLGSGRYLMAIHINRRDHVANHGATYSAVVEVE